MHVGGGAAGVDDIPKDIPGWIYGIERGLCQGGHEIISDGIL